MTTSLPFSWYRGRAYRVSYIDPKNNAHLESLRGDSQSLIVPEIETRPCSDEEAEAITEWLTMNRTFKTL